METYTDFEYSIIILQEYSVSSVKVRGSRPPASRRSQHTAVMLDEDEQVGDIKHHVLLSKGLSHG